MGRKKTVIERRDLLSVRVKGHYTDVFFAEHDNFDTDEFMCIVLEIYNDEKEGEIYDVIPLDHSLMKGEKLYITREEFTIKKLS